MTSICRLCLNSSANHYETIATIEEKYFQLVLPEIDIYLVQTPMFCQSCIESLQTTYSFKSTCMETEKMLKLYALECGEEDLLLSDVLQFQETNQILSGNNYAERLLTKQIKVECDNDGFGCDSDMSYDTFSCNLCKENFDSDIQLHNHTKEHKKPLKCKICEISFPSNYTLKRHERSHAVTLGNKQLQCNICKVILDDKNKLGDHLKSHFQTYVCTLCDKLYSDEVSICKHLSTIHEIKLDLAEQDLRRRPEIEIILDEVKLKQQLALFESPNDTYKDSSDNEHKKLTEIMDSNTPFQCQDCGNSFCQKKLLIDHIKTHYEQPYCLTCDKAYANYKGLKRHMLHVHKIDISKEHEEQLYTMYPEKEKLDESIQKHLELYKSIIDIEGREISKPDEDQQVRPYKCKICKKTYHVKSSLWDHIRVHFTKSDCKLCRKQFYNILVLKRHLVAVHQIDLGDDITWRDYISVIVEVAEMEEALKEHGKIYEMDDGEHNSDSDEDDLDRQYKCNICKKNFHRNRRLRDHIRLHFTKSNCKLCGKQYYNTSVLKRHLMKIHQIDLGDDITWRDHISIVVNVPAMEQALKEHDKREEMNHGESKSGYDKDPLELVDNAPTGSHSRTFFGKLYPDKSLIFEPENDLQTQPELEIKVEEKLINSDVYEMNVDHEEQQEKIDESMQKHLELDGSMVHVKRRENSDAKSKNVHNRPYKCNMCEKDYLNKRNLANHIRIHFTKSNCNLCGKRFYNVSVLKRHLMKMHQIDLGDDVTWRDHASIVVDVLEMEEALKKHSKPEVIDNDEHKSGSDEDQSGRPYKCKLCKKAYHNKKGLLDHIRNHFTKSDCKLCGNRFYNVPVLKRHLVGMHQIDLSDDVTWRQHSSIVVDAFEMSEALKEHSKLEETFDDENKSDNEEDPAESYTCKTCGKKFGSKSLLSRHKLTHRKKSFTCNYCRKVFLNNMNFARHTSVCQLGFRPRRKPGLNFTCEICGTTKYSKNALIVHIRTHTGEKPYKCDLCDKAFSQTSSVAIHKQTVHSTERLFTCEYCSKSFKGRSYLSGHIRTVHMIDKIEKKFSCNYCMKKFLVQSQLKYHLKFHTSDRQFKCDICRRAYVNKSSLKKHRVTHFAEKQHKCEICGKGFHRKYNVKVHIMKNHSKSKVS